MKLESKSKFNNLNFYDEYQKSAYICSFAETIEIYNKMKNRTTGDTITYNDYIDFLIDWYEYNNPKKKKRIKK